MKIELPETRTVAVSEIVPYWRNPRRITDEAVKKVSESLDLFGNVQPIVVDTENVIIAGHTRHAALVQLGIAETEVYVASHLTPELAREYRLADNRLGELTSWDHSSLVLELREWETALLEDFFPEIDLQLDEGKRQSDVTAGDVSKAEKEAQHVNTHEILLTTAVECPSCLQYFEVQTSSLPGLSRLDLEQLEAAQRSDDGEASE